MNCQTDLLVRLLTFIVLAISPLAAHGQDWRHGGALFGELKYGPDFKQYEHVNSDAPKGGTFNQAAAGGFDSFNPFVVRGRAAAGLNYTGGLLYDTLFEQSVDQPSASYGLVAEAFSHPEDFSSATYRLNGAARWHDGTPITAEDVIWSLEKLKEVHPLYAEYFRNVVKAEKTGEREVTFTFDIKGNRELPHIIGDLPILPREWWEGVGPDGKKRDISQPTTEVPLGSGPYRIANFDLGKNVVWQRVDDYWGKDLPVRKGRYNFGAIRYTYFLDENALWEAFKKGGITDTRAENRSQRWATEYNFPAFERKDVLRKAFDTQSPEPFQAYFFNTRNPKFADVRVRKALTLLFDFESMNRTLFFGLYTRTDSYFEGGELQAPQGLPQGREKEILEEYRDRISGSVIDEPFELPVYGSPADTRKHQRAALKLLTEAGYRLAGGKLVDAAGKQFEIEFLGSGPTDERVGIPTVEYLRPLGIKATIRIVDDAQYKNRIDGFDFEVSMLSTAQSLSPGNEQREYWTSRSADRPGGRNYSGIKDPVLDELVERIISAPNRDELVALTQAMDRILLHGYYAIPMWHNPEAWFAWWRKLQFPPTQPAYSGIDLYSLWIDETIEAEMEKGN
ncbi:MAG: extracellular solute-binding protein [Rhizobiaceae bacterium]